MGSLIKYFHDCSDCPIGNCSTQEDDEGENTEVFSCNLQYEIYSSIEVAMENCPFKTAENKMIKFVLQEDKPNP